MSIDKLRDLFGMSNKREDTYNSWGCDSSDDDFDFFHVKERIKIENAQHEKKMKTQPFSKRIKMHRYYNPYDQYRVYPNVMFNMIDNLNPVLDLLVGNCSSSPDSDVYEKIVISDLVKFHESDNSFGRFKLELALALMSKYPDTESQPNPMRINVISANSKIYLRVESATDEQLSCFESVVRKVKATKPIKWKARYQQVGQEQYLLQNIAEHWVNRRFSSTMISFDGLKDIAFLMETDDWIPVQYSKPMGRGHGYERTDRTIGICVKSEETRALLALMQ